MDNLIIESISKKQTDRIGEGAYFYYLRYILKTIRSVFDLMKRNDIAFDRVLSLEGKALDRFIHSLKNRISMINSLCGPKTSSEIISFIKYFVPDTKLDLDTPLRSNFILPALTHFGKSSEKESERNALQYTTDFTEFYGDNIDRNETVEEERLKRKTSKRKTTLQYIQENSETKLIFEDVVVFAKNSEELKDVDLYNLYLEN